MSVMCFKLVTGEEVIAKVNNKTADFDDRYVIDDARTLMLQQGPDNTIGVAMVPFMASANDNEMNTEKEIVLFKNHVVALIENISISLEKAYLSQTSKLVLA